jgi:hypothetical protein
VAYEEYTQELFEVLVVLQGYEEVYDLLLEI